MQLSEAKEHIKTLPISSIIDQFMPLRKRGANHEAICPFHDDHDPSLKVNDSKGLFKCFVCSEAGDAISFVQKYLKIDFVEAVKKIAENLSITIEESKGKKKNPKFDLALRILKSLEKLYHGYAHKTSPAPYENFIKNRKLTNETANNFRLGFAPHNNIAVNYLENKHKENPDLKIIDLALEIGVIKKSAKGHLYDTFRNRITFPIWDQSGNTRGFGSRSIRDDQIPKYLNSKESFIFNKKYLLYGLNIAKKSPELEKGIILTEGYMDTIALHQFGFTNAVAIMGIALSENKAQSLKNLNSQVYLSFDSDNAGFKASERVNETFNHFGVIPKVINLNPYKDPDELLQEEGALFFQKKLDSAIAFIDLLIEKITAKDFGANMDRKIEALQEVFKILAPLGDSMNALERAINAANILGLKSTRESVIESFKESIKNKSRPKTFIQNQSASYEAEQERTPNSEQAQSPYINLSKNERWILEYLIQTPLLCRESRFTELLNFVKNENCKNFILKWSSMFQEGVAFKDGVIEAAKSILDEDIFEEKFRSEIFSFLYQIKVIEQDQESRTKLFEDLLRKLRMHELKEKKISLLQKRTELYHKEEIEKLDQEVLMIIKEISEIKNKYRINTL